MDGSRAMPAILVASDWVFLRRVSVRVSFLFRPLGRVTFLKRQKSNQKGSSRHPAPASPGSPRSGIAPRVGVQGPSLALYASRGIHAARPSAQYLHSAS